MKTIARIYDMDVKRSKRKMVIEGKQIDLLERHFREFLPNMVFLDETLRQHVERAIRITFRRWP